MASVVEYIFPLLAGLPQPTVPHCVFRLDIEKIRLAPGYTWPRSG